MAERKLWKTEEEATQEKERLIAKVSGTDEQREKLEKTISIYKEIPNGYGLQIVNKQNHQSGYLGTDNQVHWVTY